MQGTGTNAERDQSCRRSLHDSHHGHSLNNADIHDFLIDFLLPLVEPLPSGQKLLQHLPLVSDSDGLGEFGVDSGNQHLLFFDLLHQKPTRLQKFSFSLLIFMEHAEVHTESSPSRVFNI